MGVVATWLTGCGLEYAVDNFKAAGIVTPDSLAELDPAHFGALGITNDLDRRKLFFLVHRIKIAIQKERDGGASAAESTTSSTATTAAASSSKEAKRETNLGSSPTRGLTAREEELAAIAAAKLEQSQSRGESSEQQIATSPAKTGSNDRTPNKASVKSPKSSPSKIPPPSSVRSPSRLTPPRSTGVASKQNITATSPGETTSPNQNRTPCSKIMEEEHNAEDSAETHRSKRIAQKGSTTANINTKKSKSPHSSAKVTNTGGTTSKAASSTSGMKFKAAPKKTLTEPTGTAKSISRRSSSGLKTPQPKSKVGLANNTNKSATLPQPSRLTSKLQNPPKSTRTGKQLSSIPADEVLPMSPMIPPKLDNEENNGTRQRKPNLVQPKSLSRRSLSNGRASSGKSSGDDYASDGDASDAESVGGSSVSSRGSESQRGRRTTMTSSSRSRRDTGSRSTGGNVSDSDSSVNSSKRRRSMGVPAPKTKIKLAKGRASDIASTTRRPATSRTSTTTRTSTGQSSTQAKKLSGKGTASMSIQGGSAPEASFKAQITALRQEVSLEHELFSDAIFQDNDDEDDHMIRVIVRKRPFNKNKSSDSIDAIQALDYGYYGKMLVYQPVTRVDLTKEIHKIPFSFDGVYDDAYDNSQIYNKSVRNMIPVVLDGQHATVFAFGATGSGKTHTMMGSSFTGDKVVQDSNMGLYYMAALDIFQCLEDPEYSHLTVGVSLFEIYSGKLFDLLNNRRAVKCLEDHQGKVQFPGLSEHQIFGPPELIELIELGAQSRSTGTTSRNADSSRSHAVLQLHLRKTVGRKTNVEHGRLTFIDLAGSERGADTANFSRATRLEGAEINTSLLALKEVIRARARGGSMVHVPFRGSKLTQVLKESFVGENNRSLMIACIAPDMDNCEQTLNTLRYADRVKERNPETGDLPAKFVKRGGRRRTSMLKSSASISSIVSTSDQSTFAKYDKYNKNNSVATTTMKPLESSALSEDSSFSGSKSSMKESDAGVVRRSNLSPSRTKTASQKRQLVTKVEQEIAYTVSEDDETDALLDAVLSEDASSLVTDNDIVQSQSSSLVDELIATHDSFLKAVMGMVQEEIDVLVKLKGDSSGSGKQIGELEVMLRAQGSLISDIRECFQSYESLSIGKELQSLNTVLNGLLEIVDEEISIAKNFDRESDLVNLEALQEKKIETLAVLEEVFLTEKVEESNSAAADVLLSESLIRSEAEDDDLSVDSFEDLRV